jgi:hypothetical protein
MPEELEVYPRHSWNVALVFKQAAPIGPQRHTAAWHGDVAASATAIARWEDDGGRLAPIGVSAASPRSGKGRIMGHVSRSNRDI